MATHYHNTSCDCDPALIDLEIDFAMDKVRNDPVAAVRAISDSRGKPDTLLFQGLVGVSLTEPRIWRAGAVSVYIRYILEGYERFDSLKALHDPSVSPPPLWILPLTGILNVLAGINKQNSAERDSAVLDECRSSYHDICAVIWRDLSRLLPPGPQTDLFRSVVSQYMIGMASIAKYQQHMYDDTTLALMMHCWLNMSVDRKQRKHAVALVWTLLKDLDSDNTERDQILDRAVRTVSVDMITLRIKAILLDPHLMDDAIDEEITVLTVFVIAERPWSSAFVLAKVYDSVINAVLRQLESGSAQSTPDVLDSSMLILNILMRIHVGEGVNVLTDMIKNSSLLQLLAQGLICTRPSWIATTDWVTHALHCINPQCDLRPTPAYIAACCSELEPLYLLTLNKLAKQGGPAAEARRAWENLAAVLNISEEQLLNKWKLEKKCCFPLCTKRASKDARTKMMTCMACESVFYHGKVCQKGDWKRHKQECKQTATV